MEIPRAIEAAQQIAAMREVDRISISIQFIHWRERWDHASMDERDLSRDESTFWRDEGRGDLLR